MLPILIGVETFGGQCLNRNVAEELYLIQLIALHNGTATRRSDAGREERVGRSREVGRADQVERLSRAFELSKCTVRRDSFL